MEQQNQGQKAAMDNMATLRYGPYHQPGPYANKTVSQLKSELGDAMSIPPDAKAYKGKEELSEDYVIQPGEHIEFARKMGEKG